MNKFTIVIPTYNSREFIGRCLESVINQDYPDFKIVVIDDASNDGTWEVINEWPYKHRINIIHNDVRKGSAIANLKAGIELYADKDDIIVCIDGDDYLYDNSVLSYLDSIYTNDVWLTYGQNISLSGKLDRISQPLNAVRTWITEEITTISLKPSEYRHYGLWHTSHLRTFRRWLFDMVKDEDLRDERGEYFRTCCDVCAMYPMIEMADSHVRFVDKILYVYNDLTNNYGNRAEENMRNMLYLQSKPIYEAL